MKLASWHICTMRRKTFFFAPHPTRRAIWKLDLFRGQWLPITKWRAAGNRCLNCHCYRVLFAIFIYELYFHKNELDLPFRFIHILKIIMISIWKSHYLKIHFTYYTLGIFSPQKSNITNIKMIVHTLKNICYIFLWVWLPLIFSSIKQ